MTLVNSNDYELIMQIVDHLECDETIVPQLEKIMKQDTSVREIVDRSFCSQVDALASFIMLNSEQTKQIVGSVYVNCDADIEIDCSDMLSEDDDLEEYVRDNLDLSYALCFSSVSIQSSSIEIKERLVMRPYEEVAQLV